MSYIDVLDKKNVESLQGEITNLKGFFLKQMLSSLTQLTVLFTIIQDCG